MNGLTAQFPLLLLSSSILLAPLSGQSVDSSSIRAALQSKIAQASIPGLSCAVVLGDDVVYAEGFGFADVENDVVATENTVYRLASISKPITAVLAMQLVEQGKLDLDADVGSFLSAWPKKRWPVTTRQLLAHLGGVRHYKLMEGESTRRYPNQIAGLARFAKDPLLHEPGTKYRYSTFGFNLVAAVVESAYGQSFGAVLKQRIAIPCEAPSLQDDDQRRIIKGRAQGYVLRRGPVGASQLGQLQNSKLMDSSYKLGGGGLCSSAKDLARFAAAVMAGRLLKPETTAAMWTRQKKTDGKLIGCGLGFGLQTVRGQRFVQHSGAQSRVSTMLCMMPDDRIGVAIMCNLEGVRLKKVAHEIALSVRSRAASNDREKK